MKIIRNDIIYIQLEDINYIVSRNFKFPRNIVIRTIEQGYVAIDEINKYDFICYKDTDIVDYFKDLDVIVNYDELKELSVNELRNKCDSYLDQKDMLLDSFNEMALEEKIVNHSILEEVNNIEYKYYQTNKYLLFKCGYDSFNLPKELQKEKKIFKNIFKKDDK